MNTRPVFVHEDRVEEVGRISAILSCSGALEHGPEHLSRPLILGVQAPGIGQLDSADLRGPKLDEVD
ncbi:hypothetical protein, partial [Pseudomonas viridiflava]|uniref:hypothetical protein n=1 Tax=Pseudomonas viridiflava TaxID=33069 RepID=UPI001980C28D